jgi:hypothetical protein
VAGVERVPVGQSHDVVRWLERRNLSALPIGASAFRMLLARLDHLRTCDSIGKAEEGGSRPWTSSSIAPALPGSTSRSSTRDHQASRGIRREARAIDRLERLGGAAVL